MPDSSSGKWINGSSSREDEGEVGRRPSGSWHVRAGVALPKSPDLAEPRHPPSGETALPCGSVAVKFVMDTKHAGVGAAAAQPHAVREVTQSQKAGSLS